MDLKVKIRKKYKQNLTDKWKKEDGSQCELCWTFYDNECKRCPFNKFKKIGWSPCMYWIYLVDKEYARPYYPIRNATYHKRFINRAKKLITFY